MKKTAALMVIPVLALAAGCTNYIRGEAQPYWSQESSATAQPSSEAAPSTVEQPPEPTEEPTNARGNYDAQIGELQEVFVIATGAPVLSFTVDAITPGFECTGPYSSPSENGQFIAVTMSIATIDLSELGGNLNLSGYDFQVIGADGTVENDATSIATYSCLSDAEQFPLGGIGQGVNATAKFVLDTKHAAGSIVFRPYFIDGGWEYAF